MEVVTKRKAEFWLSCFRLTAPLRPTSSPDDARRRVALPQHSQTPYQRARSG